MTELGLNASDQPSTLTRTELVAAILHYIDLRATYMPKDQLEDFVVRTWREWLKSWSQSDMEIALSVFSLLDTPGVHA